MSTFLSAVEDKSTSDIILISSDSEDEKQNEQTIQVTKLCYQENLSNQEQNTESCLAAATLEKSNTFSEDIDLNIDDIFQKVRLLLVLAIYFKSLDNSDFVK